MNHQYKLRIAIFFFTFLSTFLLFLLFSSKYNKQKFLYIDSSYAYSHIQTQVNFGPRVNGEVGHLETQKWIQQKLTYYGLEVTVQTKQIKDLLISNVIGETGHGNPWILIGTHYDTRQYADKDPIISKRTKPVPGANDGASGVAILLEIARNIQLHQNIFKDGKYTFAFFDAEDNGGINGQEWLQGSSLYADSLEKYPDFVIIVDMIGDKDLQIFYELNSDIDLSKELWAIAKNLGYQNIFILKAKHRIIDDHIPFIKLGIPSIDIIDLDYPYWHTTDDTIDKIDPKSLQVVGDTILNWLLSKSDN